VDVTTLFFVELLIIVVLLAVLVGAAIYFLYQRRQAPPEEERGPVAARRPPSREFYKMVGHEMGREIKVRLYSLKEYEEDLGGDVEILRGGDFLAAIKAYRPVEGEEWHDLRPERAAELLELGKEDYEPDHRSGALLVRRLPPGVPASALDLL
jgi:hypothetical protein